MPNHVTRHFDRSAVLLVLFSTALASHAAGAGGYAQHNLVSDIPGIADQTDPNLVNPWAISMSPTSPFWISNNHAGVAAVYNGQGQPAPAASPLIVRIPGPTGDTQPAAPTGQVFNDTTGFNVSGQPATFIFATEGGTISGWNPSADRAKSIVLVDNSTLGAVYKGANLTPVISAGAFRDASLPSGFAPFNIQRIGRKLYVTYAMQDQAKHDDVAGGGNGFIDVFDFSGNLLARLVSNGALNSPWGLAMAPGNFGDFSNALLVANFGDGKINAFDPCSGEYLGSLQDSSGAALAIPGLWALSFGNGRSAGDANTLYFTVGIPGPGNVEDHGLFGSIQVADAAPAAQPQPTAATINNFAFMPATVTIAAVQVQWTNQDGTAHTVTADDARFHSDILDGGQTFSQAFSTPGVYSYHCSIHPFMKGKLSSNSIRTGEIHV